jgi:hypothetical protein
MVKIRGHHFICLHFLTGYNAGQDFIDNMEKVKDMALTDGLELVDGIDDVCEKCPSAGECSGATEKGNKVRGMDAFAIRLLDLERDRRYSWSELTDKLPAIIPEWRERECVGCPEFELCRATEAWNDF